MQIAFYKGRSRLFNRAVSWWLSGPYSHCELVLWTQDGVSYCVSSSFSDGGVRMKAIVLNPDHWDLIEVEGDVSAAINWLDSHDKDLYDLLGLLGFVWRRQDGNKSRWFCSEAVAAMLGFNEPWRFDPMSLYSTLTKKTTPT